MSKASYTLPELKPEYEKLYATCKFRPEKVDLIARAAKKIASGKARYEELSQLTQVPWYVIGVLHYREGNCNFETHLYNGDPLTARTVHEPAGHPLHGSPPFTFEYSAQCALHDDRFTQWHDWSIAGMLFRCEGFNGWGYRPHKIETPYLWGYSQHYIRGGFPRDHVWDDNYVSDQCGCAVLIKWMDESGIIAV